MNSKTLLAGLVGGVAAFLLGWVLYGMLLESFMKENFNQCMSRPMEEMIWWALILSNLLWGLLVAVVLGWANVSSFMGGLTKGATLGLLIGACYSLQFHAFSTWYNNTTAMMVDLLMGALMTALIGGVVGWMLGRGNTAAA